MLELITDPEKLHPVPGIRLGVANANIKYTGRDDLVLMALPDNAQVAAVFTQNAFCAAPVMVAKKHLAHSQVRCLLVNAGNANAGTGQRGIDDALLSCQCAAEQVACSTEQVLPFSTGVIGEYLPMENVQKGIVAAANTLQVDGWQKAAQAILTTDTRAKVASVQVDVGGTVITVTGMSKGAGMMKPDMATLLAYVATDVNVDPDVLKHCLNNAVRSSFNRITVDGDTSTNDSCVLIASGESALPKIDNIDSSAYYILSQAVAAVCEHLAKAIIRDAEGATKFITINVLQGSNEQECEAVAYTVGQSPLVKTALFASDPNWGRLIMAIGRAGVPGLDTRGVGVSINNVVIVRNGVRAEDYTEAKGQEAMRGKDIVIDISLARGEAQVTVWTCDFSYDYVKINAEYRT